MIFDLVKNYDMKKLLLSLTLIACGFVSMAQNAQYESAMKGLMMKMNGATVPEAYQAIANGFERVANAESKEWLPRYYAAFNFIMQAYMTSDKSKVDGILDIADKHLADADALLPNNDEIKCLAAWAKSARIGVDPMSRGMKYGMESAQLLEEAKKINASNPRIYFMQGQSAFYTPEAFGGGKTKAKALFAKAVELYGTFTPANEMMPNWGSEQASKMLEECNK
jgi:GNAT superfamily N-acetyltransferase